MSEPHSPEAVRVLECLSRLDTEHAQRVLTTCVFTIMDGARRGLTMADIVIHCQDVLADDQKAQTH